MSPAMHDPREPAPPSRCFDAVVFDLDGTLVDTLADIAAAMNAVLAARGFPTHAVDAYKTMVGDGALVLAQRTLPPAAAGTAGLAEECAREYSRQYQAIGHGLARPYDGIAALLDGLRALGVAATVLSNKPHELAVECVDEFFPPGTFRVVLGQRPGTPRKPDPAGVHEIVREVGAVPDRCLYVGDTPTDMETAAAAGLPSVGVTWGFRPEHELRAAGARYIVRHPSGILALVKGLLPQE